VGDGLSDIGIAYRRLVDKTGFEAGPIAAMKLRVSARLKLPCMP
jgi:hypothetical protein